MPPASSSSARSAMWNRNSRSRSRSRRPGRKTFQRRLCQAIDFSLRVADHASHAFGEARPALFFQSELLPALSGDGVEARLAVFFGGAPIGADPAFLLHAVERGVERALFDAQQLF